MRLILCPLCGQKIDGQHHFNEIDLTNRKQKTTIKEIQNHKENTKTRKFKEKF